ncbi:related to cylicin I [Rhynchosporium secalis]|uniref:Related to cylicin I n=1 Tax=Rhynchosporium secalis TaxID=38038 RepID=A0A1E1LW87_RHYSE|nr:related to cylicin I [Rhynchosporium secalis]
MAFSRAAALRSCIRAARPATTRPQLVRQIARRGYASGGHGSAKSGGDAIWALGAVGVTAPACYYILSNAPDTSHGHGDHGAHGDEHDEEHKEESEESDEESKDESKDEPEAKAEEKSDDAEEKSEEKSIDKEEESEKSVESDSEDDKKDADTPETSDDEGEDTADGKNTKTVKPDAKGGNKKRFESKQGKKAGESDSSDDGDAAPSKPVGDKNSQTAKQEGLTNTDTKHSTDISNDPEKSKKAEGGPDTAKVKGTIDPNRKQGTYREGSHPPFSQ